MPYNRRYNKRKPRRHGAHSMYSDPYYLGTASKALAVAYAVKKLINVEYKSLRTPWTVDPNTTGSVVNLMSIAQGDDFNDRQGRKIKLQSIRIMGNVAINVSAATTNLRMMVVRDNNGSSTPPTIATLYADIATFVANKNKLGDPQTNSRFSIIYDKWYTMDLIHQRRHKISKYIKINSHVFYSGAAAADEGKGCLYLFIASSESTNDPIVTVSSQIKYIDN